MREVLANGQDGCVVFRDGIDVGVAVGLEIGGLVRVVWCASLALWVSSAGAT